MNPFISVCIDWDDNLSFAGTDENLSTRVRMNPAMTTQRGNDQLQDLSPPMAGSATVTIDNADKLLSVSNASSAIFSELHPGHLCCIFISAISAGETFTGNGFRYDSIDGIASYLVKAGDYLQYDVRWYTGTQGFGAIDLDDGAGHRLKGSGAVDQYGLSADPQTNIGTQANNFWYTRSISLASLVGRTITRYMIGFENVAGGAVTAQAGFQNISIISTTTATTQFSIFQTQLTYPITMTNRYNTNGTVMNVNGASNIPFFTGYIDNLVQNSDPSQVSVTIPALGLLSRLKGQVISTPLYQSISTSKAIYFILTTCGIPASLFNLNVFDTVNTGNTVMDWWWLNNEDAFAAVQTLLSTEGPGAKIFEGNTSPVGKITFQNRQFRLTNATSTTSQGTFRTYGLVEPLFSKPFQYDPGLKDIVNIVSATTKVRTQQSPTVVWTNTSNITLGPSQSTILNIVNTTSDPWNSQAFSFSTSSGTASTSNTVANAFNYQVTFTAGVAGCVLNFIQLSADYVTVTSTQGVVNTLDTTASQATFGQKTYTLPIRAEIPVNVAQDLVNGIAAIYQNPRPIISFTLFNVGGSERYSTILNREISDRITVVEPQSGLSGDMWVEFLALSIPSSMFSMQIGCEQVWSNNFGVWGTAIFDTTPWGF